MEILPIQTPILKAGDDLAQALMECGDIRRGDIIVISSKAVATTEGVAICLADITASDEAESLAAKSDKPAAYYQVVLDETARMNGRVLWTTEGILLTELKPAGMEGAFLVPNAGLDRSNVEDGFVIGWPKDPVASAKALSEALSAPVVISDSGLAPRRRGVMSFALTVCGINPITSMIDSPDLFGHSMRITEEAVADQLATAANAVMGNTNQSVPAAIVRDHSATPSDFCGWVPGVERSKDIYHGVI